MQVIPQLSGALLIQDLAPDASYEFGNPRLYAQCDGLGRINSARLPEGLPLQTMREVRYLVLDENIPVDTDSAESVAKSLADQYKGTRSEGAGKKQKTAWIDVAAVPITFDTAQAMGRTWTLTGKNAGITVTMTTFLDNSNPAVYQRFLLTNNDAKPHIFALDVAISLQFEHSYVGASTAANGQIHTRLDYQTQFGATLRPWLVIMDKTRNILSYAVAIPGGESVEFCLVTAAVDEPGLQDLLGNWRSAYAEAEAYSEKLLAFAAPEDPLLRSLIVSGLNTGLSAYKELGSGVAGFVAGVSYAYPPRVYFRDSYWTAQAALVVQPELVRRNLLWLALGIGPDGSCPSGVWDPGIFTAAELNNPGVLSWIADHYDSPSFFVILLHDYITASGDLALLDERVNGRSLWEHAQACMEYLAAHDTDGDSLFEKPHAANDWADNVMRDGLVSYDLALFYRGLVCLASFAQQRRESVLAERYQTQAATVKAAINQHLWDPDLGYYRAYQREGFVETHLSIDVLLTVLYGIAEEDQAQRTLAAAHSLLQTRHNPDQTYGDWGVMCCYPFYHDPADLFSISAQPYHYHNGADWPYWDGVYGLILLQRNDPDWRYVLTRWWEVGLQRGWLTPVEYFSPAHPRGGLLQGWSAMPAVALLPKQYIHWLYPEPISTP